MLRKGGSEAKLAGLDETGYLTAVACFEMFLLKSEGPFAQMNLITRSACKETNDVTTAAEALGRQ